MGECTTACQNASWGDMLPNKGGGCDNGADNKAPMDAVEGECTMACQLAACGDMTQNADEECDDGPDADDDECSLDCFAPRRVFLSFSKCF